MMRRPFSWKKWFKWCVLGTFLLFVSCGAGLFLSLPTQEMAQASRAARALKGEGGEVHFLRSGAPEASTTFFLVHGTPGESANWGAYLADESLKSDYQVIAFDRLGFGKSKPEEAVPQLAHHAKALAEVAKQVPGRKIWVGHSYGVPVIGRVAADFPGLVDGALLIAGPADPELTRKTWYQALAATSLGQSVISRDLKTANVEMLSLSSELEIIEPFWARMKVPVTVLHAEDDVLAKYGSVSFLQERLPEKTTRYRLLEEGNHFLIWSHYDLVLEEMRLLAEGKGREND